MSREGLYDEVHELEEAEREAQVLQLRIEGKQVPEIAAAVGLGIVQVYRIIKKEVGRVKASEADMIRERFVLQDARCEWLYARCAEKIKAAEGWDAGLVRAAIAVLDRQAKLLGLDKGREKEPYDRTDWLSRATDAELKAEAERLGIPLPSTFKLPA